MCMYYKQYSLAVSVDISSLTDSCCKQSGRGLQRARKIRKDNLEVYNSSEITWQLTWRLYLYIIYKFHILCEAELPELLGGVVSPVGSRVGVCVEVVT